MAGRAHRGLLFANQQCVLLTWLCQATWFSNPAVCKFSCVVGLLPSRSVVQTTLKCFQGLGVQLGACLEAQHLDALR